MLIRKNVLRLAFPIMVEQIFVMLLGVCNTIMAGHIGEEAVSAIGMVDTLNNIFIQALASGLILSLSITIFMWIFRTSIINTFYGSAEELVKLDAKTYIEFTLITYPFIAIEQIANGILRGTGNTRTPMNITIFMNVVNIILGYILIYGVNIFGVKTPSFGIEGAALAIAIARLIGTIIIVGILIKGTGNVQLKKILPFG